jgi:hypothetical protein
VSKTRIRRRPPTAQPSGPVVAPNEGVLALQRLAGNQAVNSLLRKPGPKTPPPTAKPASKDLVYALDYVQDFFQGVHDVLDLKDKVEDVAIRNYSEFGKLKDPPKLSDAIIGAIFSTLVGLIPGGTIIKLGITTGLFALDMRGLRKDLEVMPIPGVSAEDEKAKGPTAKHTEKAGKIYEHGKTGYDTGKAVYDAVKAQREAEKAASEAEASAKEIAGLQHGRITHWVNAINDARAQEAKIKAWLREADDKGAGGLEAAVHKRLGDIPAVNEAFQRGLEKEYELELYRAKYAKAKWVTTTSIDEMYGSKYVNSRIEGADELSEATRRRIAELDGHPFMWEYPAMIAIILKLRDEKREVKLKSDDRLKAGMKF